jgi:hypothetical protein
MAIVMINCPATGKPISTQHRASEVQFAAQTYDNAAVRCAACGEIHRWSKADAWLQPYRGVPEPIGR